VDGAHNEASAAVLARTIEGFIPGERLSLSLVYPGTKTWRIYADYLSHLRKNV